MVFCAASARGGRRKPGVRRKWTLEEQTAVRRNFGTFIMNKKAPGKADIEAVLKLEPCLRRRTWTNIKDFIRNSRWFQTDIIQW